MASPSNWQSESSKTPSVKAFKIGLKTEKSVGRRLVEPTARWFYLLHILCSSKMQKEIIKNTSGSLVLENSGNMRDRFIMKTPDVTYTLDTLPSVSPDDIRLAQSVRDEDIDYSDIPPLNPKDWKNAIVGGLCRPTKKQITLRIDSDVLLWLRSMGKGYQTRANQILRDAMNAAV